VTAAVDGLQRLLIKSAIEDLNASFAHHLDHNEIEALSQLFTHDALYTHGERRSAGREAIRALFVARAAAGMRTTRHMISGLRIEIHDAGAASGSSTCANFAADGLPPLSPAVPHLVADFIDTYVCGSDGIWRIASRDIRRIFVAPNNVGPVGG
jgi:ketosteroid isomerase-like protein